MDGCGCKFFWEAFEAPVWVCVWGGGVGCGCGVWGVGVGVDV